MDFQIKSALKAYSNIVAMLRHIPEQVWDLFLPDSPRDLAALEASILAFKKREAERDQVMAIQQLCGFPLRPNASLRETKIKAKILGQEKKRKYFRRDDNDEAAA